MLYFLCLEDFLIISFSLFIFTYFPDIQTEITSAFLILRLSLATKFIFYAQTIDPDLALPFACQFDQIIIDTFSKLVDSAPNEFAENAIRQMQLPVKEGGCGFHSHSIMDLHKFYVSSALLASPTV